MAKNKGQNQQGSQKKSNNQHMQKRDGSSRGCCGCIFGLIRQLIVLTAVAGLVYIAVFTGYTYHMKNRVPTTDEFKTFSMEMYSSGRDATVQYYNLAEKHTRVYYAHFEKNQLPVIQKYTKEYTKFAAEKFAEFQVIAGKFCKQASQKLSEYYKLAMIQINEYQSGGSKTAGSAKQQAEPKKAATQAPTPKPTQAPTPKPQAATTTQAPKTTPKPTQAPTPAPTQKPKPAEAPKKATTPSSKEKKEL